MNRPLFLRSFKTMAFHTAAAVCACLAFVVSESFAQTPYLEYRYEFDTTERPMVDSTGQMGEMLFGSNGPVQRLGEPSLVGGDGYSIGLDAPGDGHPTGSYLVVDLAPQPESFSYSIWIKPQLTGTTEAILSRDNVWWPSPCAYYCLYIDDFQSLVWKTGGSDTILTDEAVIESDETYHVVVTYADTDGPDTGIADRTRVYVNGQMIAEEENPTEIPSLDSIADGNGIYEALWLGTLSSLGGYWGEMDDFQSYSTELSPEQVAEMYANPGTVANFGAGQGDFDGNGVLDANDIDDLTRQSASKNNPAGYDLNNDSLVDANDIGVWVKDLYGTWIGDADLDGEFNSTDLVVVLSSGTYEADVDSVWSTGDFNGDGRTNSGDLVAALSDGGYEQGPVAAVEAVPEPVGATLALVGLLSLVCARRIGR